MPDYQKGKIYKIVNDEMPNLVYYGSTIQTLCQKMTTHRQLNSTSRKLFECGKAEIILVEKYPCDNKEELKRRVRHYIENNDCINKYRPITTKEEQRISTNIRSNKRNNIIKQERQIYNEKYPEEQTKRGVRYKCDCGGYIKKGGRWSVQNKTKHNTSKQHQKYLENNINE